MCDIRSFPLWVNSHFKTCFYNMTKILFSCWQQYGQHQDGQQDKMSSDRNREAATAVSVMIALRANANKCWKHLSLHSAWLKIEFLELLVIFPDFKVFCFCHPCQNGLLSPPLASGTHQSTLMSTIHHQCWPLNSNNILQTQPYLRSGSE